MAERWRPVLGWTDRYEVSDQGRVRSYALSQEGRILKPYTIHGGYPAVDLMRAGTRQVGKVHRLVLCAFDREPREGEITRHLNGDPTDNRLENLAWGTPSENMADRVRHGTDRNAQKTHCPRGHLLDTSVTRPDGSTYRRCSICRVASQRRSNAKRDYSTEVRPRAACQECAVEMRADGIPRHMRRTHAVGRAL